MVIDKEFENLLPPLSEEDYKGLEESIKADGCRDPLVVWGDTLVDGHNRYKICTQNNISYQIVKRDFPDREAVILWIIINQMSRRNLTPFQRSELALRLKPKLTQEAKERMVTSTGGSNPQPKDNLPKPVKRVREQLGEIAGVSGKTIDRVETILTKGTKEDIQEVREGKSSISGKAKEIKQREVQPVVKRPQAEDSNLKDFEGAFMANSKSMLMVLANIQDDCKPDIPTKYKAKFNRIIKAIEELREYIGG